MVATVSSIPASQYVNVTPSVLSAGGAALLMSGLFLTTNTRIPIGTIQSFPNVSSVSSYFGPTDPIVASASVYFAGPNLATQQPAALLMAPPPGPRALIAWLARSTRQIASAGDLWLPSDPCACMPT